jgi:peptidyl-tRNA hydrolase, PTH1 family
VKVVVGLGNPGPQYARSRHNIAWWVLDHLADTWRFDAWKRDGDGLATTAIVHGVRTRLIKPQTYVNLSGAVLRPYVRRPTWAAETDLLVVVDEIALPLGTFRLRALGSSGGHNGLKSIEGQLGSRAYARLRIGIRPEGEHPDIGPLADFVLGDCSREERETIQSLMPVLTDAVDAWLHVGILQAMNLYNRPNRPPA